MIVATYKDGSPTTGTIDPPEVEDAEYREVEGPSVPQEPSDQTPDSPYAETKSRKTRADKGVKRGPRGPRTDSVTRRSTRSANSDTILESLGLILWSGASFGVSKLGDTFMPEHPVPGAVTRTMMLETAYAGPTMAAAFKRTPFYKEFGPVLNAVGPWKELASLFALPLLMGALAMKPEAINSPVLQGIVVESMMPALIAAKKRAAAQKEMMSQMDELGEEAKKEIMGALAWLLQTEVTPEEQPEQDASTEQPVGAS